MGSLIRSFNNLNSIEFIINSISFGDMKVAQIRQGRIVSVDYANARHQLIRVAAVRRNLIIKAFGERPPSLLADRFREIQNQIIEAILDRISIFTGKSLLNCEMIESVIRTSTPFINQIDFNDDILYLSAKYNERVYISYFSVLLLRWHATAIATVMSQLPATSARKLRDNGILETEIPLGFKSNEFNEYFKDALKRATSTLPVKRHFDLMRRPMVRRENSKIYPLLNGDISDWNVTVREKFVTDGELGKNLGKFWEEYFENRFRQGWKKIGSGIKIREKGLISTDIDLIIQRDDILLVAQIKALAGSGVSPYDHLKNSKVIETGCQQARISADYLSKYPNFLLSLMGKKLAAKIKTIVPVVITNLSTFQGWRFFDVSVIGEQVIKSLTTESKVTYRNISTREIVQETIIFSAKDLNSDNVQSVIDSPTELRIAPESLSCSHVSFQIGGVEWLLPKFDLQSNDLDISYQQDENIPEQTHS